MLKKLKSQYPDREYPVNLGKKWTSEEETLLLERLSKNIDIQRIAESHNRTTGGIDARRKVIAYKLYKNENTMEEITSKTKLDEDEIIDIINKKSKKSKSLKEKCNDVKQINEMKNEFSIENEIYQIKNDIKEIKNTLKELFEILKTYGSEKHHKPQTQNLNILDQLSQTI